MTRIGFPRISFAFACSQLQKLCVFVPGYCPGAEYCNTEPGWTPKTFTHNLLALMTLLIRCCIYIQAMRVEYFGGKKLIKNCLFSLFLPLYWGTATGDLSDERTQLMNPLSTPGLPMGLVNLRNGHLYASFCDMQFCSMLETWQSYRQTYFLCIFFF